MDWLDEFVEDAQSVVELPKEALREFATYVAHSDGEALSDWVSRYGVDEARLLVLSSLYTIYSTRDRVADMMDKLGDMRVEDAVGLIGGLISNLANSIPSASRLIVAQSLLVAALQLEDESLRRSLADLAKNLVGQR